MAAPHPEPNGPAAISRRAFLACCSAVLAASTACAALAPRTRSAYILVSDPSPEEYEPILDALIEAILPGRAAGFPVSAHEVRVRLLQLFPLEADERFTGAQKALVLFDQPDCLSQPLIPAAQEATALDAAPREALALMARSYQQDRERYERFARGGPPLRFARMTLERRRQYLDLWRTSSYLVRRQFYASVRSLVMITAYSMDAVWPAINYGGPFISGRHQ